MSQAVSAGSAPAEATKPGVPEPIGGMAQSPLYVAIVGHVDHGKSTLVGRLLHETGSLPEGRAEAVAEMCKRRGMPFEWAFVTDALQAERDQGITIDVSHIRFKTATRPYVLVDAPGHREFLKNMISGAASSEAALLLIDAHEGVRQQSRSHGYLLHLLGIRQVAVAVNKMDLVGYDRETFIRIEQEYRGYLGSLGIAPTAVIPVSAREGGNIGGRSDIMSWYEGPTVVEALDAFRPPVPPRDLPLRMPVQDIYKFDDRRIIAGRIECGLLRAGDEVLFSPSNKTGKVKAIESWTADETIMGAQAGQSIGFTLEDQVFVERGDVVSKLENPPVETNVFRGRIFWLGRDRLAAGRRLSMKLHTAMVPVTVEQIEKVLDTDDLAAPGVGETVERNGVAEVVLRTRGMVALDPFEENPRLGRFVLLDGYDVVGGGIISMEGYPDQRGLVTVKSTNIQAVAHDITEEMRVRQNGHEPGVLWFTGLSGAGKSTLAVALERHLFRKGYQVFVLDGDNVRHGLNANLGFSPEDRAENIRRVGEVAALFAQSGMIAITAFISPYRSDRDRARAAAGKRFHEIHVKADLEVCESRDPKGLYKKARAGEIKDFTGISAPYEPPENAELVVDTTSLTVDEAVRILADYVEKNFTLRRP